MKISTNSITFLSILIAVVFFAGGCGDLTPRQIHLSTKSDASTSAVVTWVTTGDQDTATHKVKYGLAPGTYTEIAEGSSHPLPNEPQGFVHEVELTGLTPGTTYYYICGDDTGGYSPEARFSTAPAAGQNFTFCVIGDMGTGAAASQNLSRMSAENPSFVLHAGDLSYANGLTFVWDTWFDLISSLASHVLYMPVIGNHEVEPSLGLSSYLGRFALPSNERWYSFDWGTTHVAALDTESPYTPGSEQLLWLQNDLAAASADPNIEWIVVFFHKPPYSASPAHGSNLSVRSNICPVLDTYGVDIVFNGHDHDYERSFPLNNTVVVDSHPNEYTNPGGTIYVVSGGGGAGLYGSGTDYWTAYSQSVFQHVKVDIEVSGTLHLQSISKDGVVLDECWVHK